MVRPIVRCLQFRTGSLLWLMMVVAAFFCGRQSDEIQTAAKRWWQVTRVRWGASVVDREIVYWPAGTLTINEMNTIRSATTRDPIIASSTLPVANQLCISPNADGKTVVSYILTGGRYRNAEMEVEVLNGKVTEWKLDRR